MQIWKRRDRPKAQRGQVILYSKFSILILRWQNPLPVKDLHRYDGYCENGIHSPEIHRLGVGPTGQAILTDQFVL